MTVCDAPEVPSADIELIARHLGEERAAQDALLLRLAEQERLLVANDVEGLERFLSGSDPMLARLQALTETRLRIMSMIARRLGVPVDSCSIKRVAEAAGPEGRDRLLSAAGGLGAVLKEIERRTRRVTVLLRHAADTNRSLLHALLGEQAPLPLYQRDGRPAPPSGLPHFTRDV